MGRVGVTLLGIIALSLVAATGAVMLVRGHVQQAAAAPAGPRGTVLAPRPRITSSELRFATRPASGVWVELKIVLDNPLPPTDSGPRHTVLLLPGTLMEDYKLRGSEPTLVAAPMRRSDGRYALVFPAPLSQSLNWYRVDLEVRHARPRPLSLSVMLDRPLLETATRVPQVQYADRDADPFLVVPEPVVAWIPGAAGGALPVLVLYTLAVTVLIGGGCAVAFLAVRR